MQVTPLTKAPQPQRIVADPRWEQQPSARPNGLRMGTADTLRALGAGAQTAGNWNGIVIDKAYIYPTESAFAIREQINNVTKRVKPVHWVTSKITGAAAYITAFHGLMLSGMLKTPGAVVAEVANGLADKVDNGYTQRELERVIRAENRERKKIQEKELEGRTVVADNTIESAVLVQQ